MEFQDSENLKNKILLPACSEKFSCIHYRAENKIMSLYSVNPGFDFLSVLHWKAGRVYYDLTRSHDQQPCTLQVNCHKKKMPTWEAPLKRKHFTI